MHQRVVVVVVVVVVVASDDDDVSVIPIDSLETHVVYSFHPKIRSAKGNKTISLEVAQLDDIKQRLGAAKQNPGVDDSNKRRLRI